MRRNFFLGIGLIIALLGCSRETLVPGISFTSGSTCKQFGLKSTEATPRNYDCIQYAYNDSNALSIKHINAGFNCCPGQFMVDLTVSGDTLIITEREESSLCDCNCLYDLEYKLTGIGERTWWIRVIEPYYNSNDAEAIVFEADLKHDPARTVCFERTGYPWK